MSSYPQKERDLQAGVTLIELLVALGIAGIFFAMLYSFLFLHRITLTLQDLRIDVRESSRLALDFIVRELRQAGARPARGVGCASFQRLTAAEAQRVTLQYDFRGDLSGLPPDGCPDDPSERVVYHYNEDSQAIMRTTGLQGRPQPFINNVPPDGFQLRYFDRNGTELIPELTAAERTTVHAIEVTVRVSQPSPTPGQAEAVTSELRSFVFLPNPPS